MKKLFFVFLIITGIQTVQAQKNVLQFDENNSYVYYRVEEKPGINADTLYQRGLAFSRQFNKASINRNKTPYEITIKSKFTAYTNSLVSRKEGGEISYNLTIDIKDNKYRYKFGSFIFTPYKLNRYGAMEAVPGAELPLEKMESKYTAKETTDYLAQISTFCNSTGQRLKDYMDKSFTLQKLTPVKKVDTNKW